METTRICPKCDKEYSISPDRRSRTVYCPPCNAAWCREYRRKRLAGESTARKPYVEPSSRICKICGIEKPIVQFNFSNKARGLRSSYCKPCQQKFGNAWRNSKPDIRRPEYDNKNTKSVSTTVQWYYEQLERQDRLCAICR